MKAQKSDNQQFEPNVSEGIHQAIVWSIVDIGTQEINSQQFGVQQKRQVSISFEFPKVRKVFDEAKGEQPCVLSQKYTLSMHEKAKLRKVCEKIMGKKFASDNEAEEFDLDVLLGRSCMVEVVHGNGYANIDNVMTDTSKEKVEPENDIRLFDLDNPDWKVFDGLHEKLQQVVMKSPEYAEAMDKRLQEETNDEEFNPDNLPK